MPPILRRAFAAERFGTAVVVVEAHAGARQLHEHDGDHQQPERDVPREHPAHVEHGDALGGQHHQQHRSQEPGEASIRLHLLIGQFHLVHGHDPGG